MIDEDDAFGPQLCGLSRAVGNSTEGKLHWQMTETPFKPFDLNARCILGKNKDVSIGLCRSPALYALFLRERPPAVVFFWGYDLGCR